MTEVTTGTTTSAQVTPFNFNSHAIRVYADDSGNPWFLANDVCEVLGYKNPRMSVERHCKEGGVTKRDTPTESGIQEMTFINEGNLYRLIIKSRKPQAVEFEQTVMDVILPSIRKTGKYEAPALPQSITPAQAQHLRELVALVVESGKQGHGETWARLHRKLKVNSYLALHPDQFDAACKYLRTKMDDASIAAIAQKHFPQIAQLAAPKPTEPQRMNLDIKTLCACILGGMIDPRAFMELAYAVNQHQFKLACANTRRGYGQEVSDKIKAGMDDADLYAITVAATMETWMRTAQPQRVAA